MFHSAGYFRGVLCPFFEHGLCHRPHCHYKHRKPASKPVKRRPPKQHSKLTTSLLGHKSKSAIETTDQIPPPSERPSSDVLQQTKSEDIKDEIKEQNLESMVPKVVEAIGKISNFFGSTLDTTNTSSDGKGEGSSVAGGESVLLMSPPDISGEQIAITNVPSYAPEKCVASEAAYGKGTTTEHASSSLEPAPDVIDNVSKTLLEDALVTEYDIFGSPGAAEDSDHSDDVDTIPVRDDEMVDAGNDMRESSVVSNEEELASIEAEFKKVTEGSTKDAKTKKRQTNEPTVTMDTAAKKKRLAHSNTEGMLIREPARVQPRPKVTDPSFVASIDKDALYMGKKRSAKQPVQVNVTYTAKRPKLSLTPNAKIPTNLRQKYLDSFIDEYLKMDLPPLEAYDKALEGERVLFDRCNRKVIYMNLSSQALKKLRDEGQQYSTDKKKRSDARVEKLSKELSSCLDDSASGSTSTNLVKKEKVILSPSLKKKKLASKELDKGVISVDKTTKKEAKWRELPIAKPFELGFLPKSSPSELASSCDTSMYTSTTHITSGEKTKRKRSSSSSSDTDIPNFDEALFGGSEQPIFKSSKFYSSSSKQHPTSTSSTTLRAVEHRKSSLMKSSVIAGERSDSKTEKKTDRKLKLKKFKSSTGGEAALKSTMPTTEGSVKKKLKKTSTSAANRMMSRSSRLSSHSPRTSTESKEDTFTYPSSDSKPVSLDATYPTSNSKALTPSKTTDRSLVTYPSSDSRAFNKSTRTSVDSSTASMMYIDLTTDLFGRDSDSSSNGDELATLATSSSVADTIQGQSSKHNMEVCVDVFSDSKDDMEDSGISFENALSRVNSSKPGIKRRNSSSSKPRKLSQDKKVGSKSAGKHIGTSPKKKRSYDAISKGSTLPRDQHASSFSSILHQFKHSKVPVLNIVRAVDLSSPTSVVDVDDAADADLDRPVSPTEQKNDQSLSSSELKTDPLLKLTKAELELKSRLSTSVEVTRPLELPLHRPIGPFINLTKVAAQNKKAKLSAASSSLSHIGGGFSNKTGSSSSSSRKISSKKTKGEASSHSSSVSAEPKPTYTIFKKKEIVLTGPLFYAQMWSYVLTEEQLHDNGYPRPTSEVGVASINRGGDSPPDIQPVGPNAMRHMCCRCSKPFIIYNSGQYQTVEDCIYHYGRLFKNKEYGEGVVAKYTCCQERRGSHGCQVAKLHVTAGNRPTRESGYVVTQPPPVSKGKSISSVYALDCEMCYTTVGLQLTRVSVIDMDLRPVYESIIKPSHPIVDYNTRFSGLIAEDFVNVDTTIEDVQQDLLKMFHSSTILLGHSLESDLRSLKIMHSCVVDTAIVFPHKKGPPFKRALKSLMAEYMHKFIQDSIEGGHDSLEDSRACMELMLWRVKSDLKKLSRRGSISDK